MATRGFTTNVILIIQVIEIIRTKLPLRKCYGFENRGRVGMIASGLCVNSVNHKFKRRRNNLPPFMTQGINELLVCN